ncbi:MAG TPA: M56 family metallopeptidase [Candidatus Sulfomarinibacteraceae bacterium]|nr:M56 family metallopeptidase [Candidatus Sulfomarinibacteraceae bacterium]
MSTAAGVVLGCLKACLLLAAAFGVTLAMRRRPARLRAAVLATALIGAVLVPFVATVVPAVSVPLPAALAELAGQAESPTSIAAPARSSPEHALPVAASPPPTLEAGIPARRPWWTAVDLELAGIALWIAGVLILVAHQAFGMVRMTGIVGRARPVLDRVWRARFAVAGREVGCRRRVHLVVSPEVDVPAVFGVVRPVVILPSHADTWLEDRRTAVLRHELVHVVRYDWPLRLAARLAAAVYWFNPLAWWAVRRLDLEQELACDEEVLSLGSRASTYACHLLGIARAAVPRPAIASAGLSMARRSHLEERIMTILNRDQHRRVGLRLILPAVIVTAALVPAIAAVQPTAAERTASPELRSAVADMREAEARLEPQLERIGEIDIEMAPMVEEIEAMEAEIDHEAIERIQAEMQPYLEQIERIAVDMAPFQERMEAMQERLESTTFHIDDGTLEEIQRQIHEQMENLHLELESVHVDMGPYREQLESIHEQLGPLHEQIARLTEEQTARIHERMERNQEVLARQHERMERLQRDLEPLAREMERRGERLQDALQGDVAAVLRSHLGPVAAPDAPFTEAAARLLEEASIHLHDAVLEVDVSRREAREILDDLFSPVRIGTEEGFDAALESAVDELADLEIRVE